jgi:hypothetical protein
MKENIPKTKTESKVNCFNGFIEVHSYLLVFDHCLLTFGSFWVRGRDRMIVGFITTYAISNYYH